MRGSFTDEERHSLMLGVLEILCPFRPRYKMDFKKAEFTTAREYHYYLGGRVAGFPLFCFEVFGLVKLAIAIF